MSKRVGRNDPCPCGSGRKFKKRCQSIVTEADFRYRHWRNIEARLTRELFSFALETLGPESIVEAWSEFYDEAPDEEYDPETPMNMVFMPWFLFTWIHEAAPPGVKEFSETTIAESFLSVYDLSPDEEKFLVAAITAPYSLCEVTEVTPGLGLTLFDMFRRLTLNVTEHSASQTLRKGEIIFCATTHLDGVTFNIATGPYPLRPTAKRDVLSLRKWIVEENESTEIKEYMLIPYEPDIRGLYLDTVKGMFQPPQLTNTDKDPFLPQKIYFDIESPEQAFNALKDLAEGVTEERLREEAILADGVVVKAEIPWLGGTEEARKRLGGPVLLGTINIDHEKMVVNVNSINRAERIRQIIEERLGKEVTYKTTLLEPIESEVQKMWATAAAARTSSSASHIELSQNAGATRQMSPADMPPELREKLEESVRQHWVAWMDLPVPALNDLTPREATKTEEGRDLLESLLLYYEGHADDTSSENPLRPDVPALRRELGMDSK